MSTEQLSQWDALKADATKKGFDVIDDGEIVITRSGTKWTLWLCRHGGNVRLSSNSRSIGYPHRTIEPAKRLDETSRGLSPFRPEGPT